MKSTELLNIQSNAEETDKQSSTSELVKRIDIEETPFQAVKLVDKGWFIALGQYRLTDYKETEEECRLMAKEKHWELLLSVISVIVETADTIKNEQNKNKEN